MNSYEMIPVFGGLQYREDCLEEEKRPKFSFIFTPMLQLQELGKGLIRGVKQMVRHNSTDDFICGEEGVTPDESSVFEE